MFLSVHFLINTSCILNVQLLKGTTNGLSLLECQHFDHNVKEVSNAYEANLLTSGEFDDRKFLTNHKVLGLPDNEASLIPTAPVTPMPHLPKRGITLVSDHLQLFSSNCSLLILFEIREICSFQFVSTFLIQNFVVICNLSSCSTTNANHLCNLGFCVP